jgi:hypothetical protein
MAMPSQTPTAPTIPIRPRVGPRHQRTNRANSLPPKAIRKIRLLATLPKTSAHPQHKTNLPPASPPANPTHNNSPTHNSNPTHNSSPTPSNNSPTPSSSRPPLPVAPARRAIPRGTLSGLRQAIRRRLRSPPSPLPPLRSPPRLLDS